MRRPRLRSKAHIPAWLAIAAFATVALLAAPGSQARSTSARTTHPGYTRGMASWYKDDHVATACGFHAKFGVANRTLKCGTKVVFIRAGLRLTAVVDDRGPYVKGRAWDLDEHTAAALHVTGVAPVWAKW